MSKITKHNKVKKKAGQSSKISQASIDEQFIKGLSPDLKKHLLELKKYENAVLKKLEKDPELSNLFLRDPGGTLVKIGIPVNPLLRKRAKMEELDDLLAPRKLCLPNGQTIKPRIKIRFIPHREVEPSAGE